jgi:hypothetical protein
MDLKNGSRVLENAEVRLILIQEKATSPKCQYRAVFWLYISFIPYSYQTAQPALSNSRRILGFFDKQIVTMAPLGARLCQKQAHAQIYMPRGTFRCHRKKGGLNACVRRSVRERQSTHHL